MKEIKLTQGKFAVVDDWNFDYLNQWKWCAAKDRSGNYYVVREVEHKLQFMHKVIIQLKLPDYIGQVDHKDRDCLNNLESNLRIATHLQNCANRGPWKGSSSLYKGVTWDKRTNKKTGKWKASIEIQGRVKHLGLFDSEKAAAKAYDYSAVTYFGEFAHLNFHDNWSVEKINRVHVTGLYLLG